MPGRFFDAREIESRLRPEKCMDDERTDHRGEQHGSEQAAVQILENFFEHECNRREWRIERRRQTRRRARRCRRALVLLRHAEKAGHGRGHIAAELHARPFAAEALATADAERTGDEFHPRQPRRGVTEVFPKRELELGDAAARRLGRKLGQQPAGQDRNAGDHGEADPRKPPRRGLQRIDETRPENPIDRHLKGHRDETGDEAIKHDGGGKTRAFRETLERGGESIQHGPAWRPRR